MQFVNYSDTLIKYLNWIFLHSRSQYFDDIVETAEPILMKLQRNIAQYISNEFK